MNEKISQIIQQANVFKRRIHLWTIIFGLSMMLYGQHAVAQTLPSFRAPVDMSNQQSLQNGARWFMNYCQGCHSLEFQRFNVTARDIGISDKLLRENLIFTGSFSTRLGAFEATKSGDLIHTAMRRSDAKFWFGVAPPDLSTIARARGADYLYKYLLTFYLDPSRPYGVNNLAFPLVGMPHVLLEIQGMQVPITKTTLPSGCEKEDEHDCKAQTTIVGFEQISEGKLDPHSYRVMVGDLVNFLVYVGEPAQIKRAQYGPWVLFFLFIFMIFAYLLNREYWKDVQ